MDFVTRQFIFLAKKFRKELHKAQESLHRDLMRLSDRLQKLEGAISTQRHTDKETNHTEPSVSVSDFRTDVPVPIEDKTKKTKAEWAWVIFKGALEILGIFAGIGLVYLAFESWQEAIDATNFSARQTELSRKSLNETTKNFRVDERAWIVVNFPHEPPQTYQGVFGTTHLVHFEMKNEGKTAAKHLEGSVVANVLRKGETLALSQCLRGTRTNMGVFFPGVQQNIYPELSESIPSIERRRPVAWDQKLSKSISDGDRAIVGCGKITYYDMFSSLPHYVTFCEVLEARPKPVPVSDSGSFTWPRIYEDCAKLNGIDNN